MIAEEGLLSFTQAMDLHPGLTPEEIGANDVHLSYLPLAHIFERLVYLLFFTRGVEIGFYNGDPTRLKDDLQALRPTFFAGVPRVYNRFADLIKANLAKITGAKKKLVDAAFETKLDNLKNKGSYTHALYDKIVMNKMKDVVGGRMKIMITGAAPLSAEIGDFLKCAFCCPIIEVYGASEGTAFTLSTPENYLSGNVGGPLANSEIKVEDVPEMNYLSTDKDEYGRSTPRGEICVRGPSILKGYYKEVEKTKEALDKDGWYHTGDIGVFLSNGALKIVDRKKNIFKLSQGEYVAPEKTENFYLLSKYITESFVYGDSFHSACIVFMVPDKDNLIELAKEQKIEFDTYENLCKNPKITQLVLDDCNSIGKKNELKGFELAKKAYLEPVSFLLQGLTTPSMKLKRPIAKDRYKNEIVEMYKGIN